MQILISRSCITGKHRGDKTPVRMRAEEYKIRIAPYEGYPKIERCKQ